MLYDQAVLKPRSDYNLTDSDHVYMIPQSIFKFHPSYDSVLIQLLTKDPLVSKHTCIVGTSLIPIGEARAG